ncbi:hypothetical protein HAX54_039714 [Datura stramonium]|uniref:Secreted protein n=1 Tax=Datura stramonium TaxID=4076 RepID=A0ABS8SJ70_DATST|nr:hypothetical protein [Datura stramonium]
MGMFCCLAVAVADLVVFRPTVTGTNREMMRRREAKTERGRKEKEGDRVLVRGGDGVLVHSGSGCGGLRPEFAGGGPTSPIDLF